MVLIVDIRLTHSNQAVQSIREKAKKVQWKANILNILDTSSFILSLISVGGNFNPRGISDFRIFTQSLKNEYCYNSRTSNDIDIKLTALTKLGQRNTTKSKKLTTTSCRQIVTSFFFWFMANLEQSGSRIGRMFCNTYIFINSKVVLINF